MKEHRAFRVWGNIAIVNFPDDYSLKKKTDFAREILNNNKSIRTVVEKTKKFGGRLRKQVTKHILGEKTKEAIYKENGCEFRFNIDDTYFSSSLAGERKEVCSFVRSGDVVLAMFAGVAPFPVVIAKNTDVKKIYSNELNRKANEYAEMNIKRNKVRDRVELLPGDIKKVALKLKNEKKNFDLILMTRPNLDETFLDEAFMLSKNGTRIYYHAFCHVDERDSQIQMIKNEAKKYGFIANILNTKNIGDIAPGKVRFRILFEVRKRGFFSRMFKSFL